MGIIANYTAYPADYIDAVIHDGDGENDTELAEYGLEKDSLLLHLALTGADDFIDGDPLSEAVIGSVSPQHLYGFTFRFALSLTLGWVIARAQASYPEHLLAATHGKTVWIASPAVLNRLENGRDWAAAAANIAGIISSGGALPEATAAQLAATYGCSCQTILRHLKKTQTQAQFAAPARANVIMDTTHFGRRFGIKRLCSWI